MLTYLKHFIFLFVVITFSWIAFRGASHVSIEASFKTHYQEFKLWDYGT